MINQMTSKTSMQARITGTITARMDVTVETTSSAMLTGMFPAPPVVAVTAGRMTADVSAALAQGGPGKKDDKGAKGAPPVNAPRFAGPGRPQGPVYHGPGPHAGKWLRDNEGLPLDQQMKKLKHYPYQDYQSDHSS